MSEKIHIPNLGIAGKSRIIEVLVSPGDEVNLDDPLLTLESDKASMEVPSPLAGTVDNLFVKVGDQVATGDVILSLMVSETKTVDEGIEPLAAPEPKEALAPKKVSKPQAPRRDSKYSGPFVRRMAFELGIDLNDVPATGSGGRVTIEDMKSFLLKQRPTIETRYDAYGEVRYQDMTAIQRLSAIHLMNVWQTLPQVTQHHWIDITELEVTRKTITTCRLTMVAIMMKIVAVVMQRDCYRRGYVHENQFCIRDYYHIGFACETPKGLVVPVVRDVDQLLLERVASRIVSLSEKARAGGLDQQDLSGSVATISSLGGIGGGFFTPIVNAPDAFILGLSRAEWLPRYRGDLLEKRYMMPISLSYDHRLIDGADGARLVMEIEKQCLAVSQLSKEELLAYKG